MKRWGPAALLLVLVACDRAERSAAPTPAPSPATAATPWTWHPLGGLAVIEGEVPEPVELVLEGRSIREHRFAEQGPVRWEFFRPPPGETAVLRTAEGRELARFEFSLPVASGRPAPGPARKPVPPAVARLGPVPPPLPKPLQPPPPPPKPAPTPPAPTPTPAPKPAPP